MGRLTVAEYPHPPQADSLQPRLQEVQEHLSENSPAQPEQIPTTPVSLLHPQPVLRSEPEEAVPAAESLPAERLVGSAVQEVTQGRLSRR